MLQFDAVTGSHKELAAYCKKAAPSFLRVLFFLTFGLLGTDWGEVSNRTIFVCVCNSALLKHG
jgi:hypothetical protein